MKPSVPGRRMTAQCVIQHQTKDQMVHTKTYFRREDVVSKGKLMQIRSSVKLLTHAISQCLPITNWNGTLIVLSEQKSQDKTKCSEKCVITADLRTQMLH